MRAHRYIGNDKRCFELTEKTGSLCWCWDTLWPGGYPCYPKFLLPSKKVACTWN